MTAATIPASPTDASGAEVPLWRLHILRTTYLLLIVGLGATILPELFDHGPTDRGVITGVLSGLWVLAFLGLRYPLQMLPLLLFELAWKGAWMLKYGLPQWQSGQMPASWAGDFQAILMGVALMPIVIPWSYVWRRYIRGPMDSVADGASKVRLRIMRTVYLLMLVPGTYIIGRLLLSPPALERGVFASMLIALFLMAMLVIRNPLKMLPVLLLELVWKAIWLAFFGLPQWLDGVGSPKLGEDIWMVGLGPVFFGLLIPWGYAWENYVRKPAERWR